MPNKCCAVGCQSGYYEKDAAISFHKFPKDLDLCNTWLQAIDRKNFTPTSNTRLCSKHFSAINFVCERNDTNLTRKKKKSYDLEKRYLKSDAIPTLFENKMFERMEVINFHRSKNSLAERRHDSYCVQLLNQIKLSDELDKITSISDAQMKMEKCDTIPSGFTLLNAQDRIHILLIDTTTSCAKVKGCIYVDNNLLVKVYINDALVNLTDLGMDMVSADGKLNRLSQIINLMAAVKVRCTCDIEVDHLQNALDSLRALNIAEDKQVDYQICKVDFIIDQLKMLRSKNRNTKNIPIILFFLRIVYLLLVHQLTEIF